MPTDLKFPVPCHGSRDHFPAASDEPNALRTRRAKRQCAQCPMRLECLLACYKPAAAFTVVVIRDINGREVDRTMAMRLTTAEADGIWGGTTPSERRQVAHLPLKERIATLDALFHSQTSGPFAVADPSEVVEVAG